MSDTTTDTPTESMWEALKGVWLEDNPTDTAAADMRTAGTRVRLIYQLSRLTGDSTTVKVLTLGARYASTIVTGTMSVSMYEMMKALDEDESLPDSVKATVGEYLSTLVTVTTAALDGAVRNTQGEDPSGDGSFTAEMRDLYASKREAAGGGE